MNNKTFPNNIRRHILGGDEVTYMDIYISILMNLRSSKAKNSTLKIMQMIIFGQPITKEYEESDEEIADSNVE